MEHLHHFGLSLDPFSNEPDLRFFFESAGHRDAQRRVERGLRQRKGLTLLTGEGGMGKTLLARRILDSLEEELFEAALLVLLPGAADATSILQRFARQLGCEEPASDRAGLLGQIYEQLAIVREDGRHAVLMIDDAQIMTPDVFAELSGLLNLEYEDRRLISMLFVGSPELDQLAQNDPSILARVDVRVQLLPLDMTNASAYLTHRLDAVGGDAAILPSAAMEALYKFGYGRPRLMNTLADNALFEAYLSGRTALDASDVERAAADLRIGPDPGTTYLQVAEAPAAPTSIVTEAPASGGLPLEPLDAASDGPTLDAAGDFCFQDGTVGEDGEALIVSEPVSATLDLDEDLDDFVLAPEMAAPASIPTLDLDEGLEDVLEETSTPLAASPLDRKLSAQPAPFLEFDIDPPSVTQYPVDPPVRDDLAEAPPLAVELLAQAEILEAELSPLEAIDGEPIEDAFVELIEE